MKQYLAAGICILFALSSIASAAMATTTDGGDTTPPEVSLERPADGRLYLFDRDVMPTEGRTVSIGDLTIQIDAWDDESAVDRVEIWIGFGCHGEKRFTDQEEPYEWTWAGHASTGIRKIRAYVFDGAGNEAFAEQELIKIL